MIFPVKQNPNKMNLTRNEKTVNVGLINFINSIDGELGRDEDSLNLFEWVVEDHYDSQLSEILSYFSERPDLQHISIESFLIEIKSMLEYFENIEEFEKCARLVKIQNEFLSRAKNLNIDIKDYVLTP